MGVSLALAYGLAGILVAGNVIDSDLYTGSAMATTAIGTLIPILHDSRRTPNEVRHALARRRGDGRVRADPARHARADVAPPLPRGGDPRRLHRARSLHRHRRRTLGAEGLGRCGADARSRRQLGVRLAVVLIFGLVALASELGLDLLLGGFVAGMITRLALRGREVAGLRVEAHSDRLRLPDPVLLRHQRDGLRRGGALLQHRSAREAAAVPRCCSWSCAVFRRSSSTAASSAAATASRSPSSARPASARRRHHRDRAAHHDMRLPRRPRSSARRSSPRSSIRWSACD